MEVPSSAVPVFHNDLPDLGHAVQLVPLADTDTPFDGDYLASQEHENRHYSIHGKLYDCEKE